MVAFANFFLKTGIVLIAILVRWGTAGATLMHHLIYREQASLSIDTLFWINSLLPIVGVFLLWGEKHYSKKY